MKIWIYRPDLPKIRMDYLYSPKGTPYWQYIQKEKENKEKIEELKDIIRWNKLNKKIIKNN